MKIILSFKLILSHDAISPLALNLKLILNNQLPMAILPSFLPLTLINLKLSLSDAESVRLAQLGVSEIFGSFVFDAWDGGFVF